MGAFELERERGMDRRREEERVVAEEAAALQVDRRRIKQECIIALKVYDHCRHLYSILQLL